mgnify:CR=1 FL=1
MKKRFLSLALVLIITLTMLPGATLAADATHYFPTIAAGSSHRLAIKTDGSLWAWGNNENGQLGDGTRDAKTSPAKVLDDVLAVYAVGNTSYAIKTNGELWGWGDSAKSRFANKTISGQHQFKIMDNVVNMSVSYYAGLSNYVFAVQPDGTLWTWGTENESNTFTGERAGAPTQLMTGVKQVASVGTGVIVLKADGTVWSFCDYSQEGVTRNYSALGIANGQAPTYQNPHQITSNISFISVDSGVTLLVDNDGGLWSMGYNAEYALGIGVQKAEEHAEPVRILDNVAWANAWSRVAITKNGELYAWGSKHGLANAYGITLTDMEKTAPYKYESSVAAFAAYTSSGLILKADGSLLTYSGTTKDTVLTDVKLPSAGGTATIPTQPTTPTQPEAPALVAKPTASTVLVNGENVAFDAYNIEGSNYFKLRDLAYALSGTEAGFEVGWDAANNAISLTSGTAYTPNGSEMASKGAGDKAPAATTAKIYLDGAEVSLTAYNIDGNNYFKLRDIGEAFDFNVSWDAARNTIVIATDEGYTAD